MGVSLKTVTLGSLMEHVWGVQGEVVRIVRDERCRDVVGWHSLGVEEGRSLQ